MSGFSVSYDISLLIWGDWAVYTPYWPEHSQLFHLRPISLSSGYDKDRPTAHNYIVVCSRLGLIALTRVNNASRKALDIVRTGIL
jgi:hypothetical protein